MRFEASAPGSLMLFGEYAVLHGHKALVAAVDKRIYVRLTPRQDKIITIKSALGEYQTTITKLKAVKPFEYILTALQQFKLRQGCDLEICSEFSHEVGFGSSAAVSVACL